MFSIKQIIIFFTFITLSYGFVPEKFIDFDNSLKRLISGQQYSFAVEYYKNNATKFVGHTNFNRLIFETILSIPPITSRKEIFKITLSFPVEKKIKSVVAYELGMLYYFNEELSESEEYLKKSGTDNSLYYLGIIALKKESWKTSIERFEKFLGSKMREEFMERKAHLFLAYSFFNLGDYVKSYNYAIKSDLQCVERAIILYLIYYHTGERLRADKTLEIIQEKYKTSPKLNKIQKNSKIQKKIQYF